MNQVYFNVLHVVLSDHPNLSTTHAQRPAGSREEVPVPEFLCCGSGCVDMELHLARRGYVPGEHITFSVDIENMTDSKLWDTEILLVKVTHMYKMCIW